MKIKKGDGSNPWNDPHQSGVEQAAADRPDGLPVRDAVIATTLDAEIAERYGPKASAKATIVVTLVEHARTEDDGPGTPRFQVMLKTLGPTVPEVATRMLREAETLFARERLATEERIS